VEATIAVLLFSTLPVTIRAVGANPYTIGIFRLAVATAAVAILLAFRGELRRLPTRDALRLAVIGLAFFAHWLTLFYAVKISSASIAAIGQSTYGIDLLLFAALFTRQRIGPRSIAAVVVAAIGAILVVPEFTFGNKGTIGLTLACVSAALYAALPLLHQRWTAIPTATRTLGQFGFALLFFLLFAGRADWSLRPRDWAGLIYLAAGVTVIGHSLWVRVTTQLPSRTTSIVYYANIPIAVILGVLLLNEPLTARMIVGALMIIAGSVYGLASQVES
jgi:drug/metabolite transporter (DMT)-like permease